MPSWWGEQEPYGIFYAIHWARAAFSMFTRFFASKRIIYCFFFRIFTNEMKIDAIAHGLILYGSKQPEEEEIRAQERIGKSLQMYLFLERRRHVFASTLLPFRWTHFPFVPFRHVFFSPSFVFSVSFADLPSVWVCVWFWILVRYPRP